MSVTTNKAGLQVADSLVRFIEERVLPGTGIDAEAFWPGMASIFMRFSAANAELLNKRDRLQAKIDAWHRARSGKSIAHEDYQKFLHEIGYLVQAPPGFNVGSDGVDHEITNLAGPQLVVPALNSRFLLNAANARWGSLYDALYGTDVIPRAGSAEEYDPVRGAKVIGYVKSFLNKTVPLARGSYEGVNGFSVVSGTLVPALKDPKVFAGYRGDASSPSTILFRHHGLHIEIAIDRNHPIGKVDSAGIADVVLESAITVIVDLEDSIAAVDADDKVAAYDNWLGLMKGDLVVAFNKDGRAVTRSLNADRKYTAADGGVLSLPGRGLLFVRNVGHLMTSPAVRFPNGEDAPEGILDAVMTALIAIHDLRHNGKHINSRTGSIYIVKPKMHGPEEVEFTNTLFDAVEDLLGLPRHTIKVGVMDEERRTSANLAACIHAAKDRIVFINTGFLDRTGDEIHTSMYAGALIRKSAMKSSKWITSYENRNVQIGIACGLSGRAQIGKGMWAKPDEMDAMMAEKIAHPIAGATTAWVPSPTAATLHAIHYHAIDVFARHNERKVQQIEGLDALLTLPLATDHIWTDLEVQEELDNNTQSILGYVVRWIDQGIGCSKVPDIHNIGLMEDRATLRISSQHIVNWMLHGVCSPQQVDDAFQRMAKKVDAQNSGDPLYTSMIGGQNQSLAYQAARALVFDGLTQPNGYTEPVLHKFRMIAKHRQCRSASCKLQPSYKT